MSKLRSGRSTYTDGTDICLNNRLSFFQSMKRSVCIKGLCGVFEWCGRDSQPNTPRLVLAAITTHLSPSYQKPLKSSAVDGCDLPEATKVISMAVDGCDS